MINRRNFELINKGIDNELSSRESEELKKLLNSDPEAKILHDELITADSLLDNMSHTDPSENLKKIILNSLDENRYKYVEGSRFVKILPSLRFALDPKIGFSFAAGLAAGLLLFMMLNISELTGTFGDEAARGTMGISSGEIFESVLIQNEDLNGSLKILTLNGSPEENDNSRYQYGIIFSLLSSEDVTFKLNYDAERLRLENLSSENLNSLKIFNSENSLSVEGSSFKDFYFVLSSEKISDQQFTLRIMRGDRSLFERQISVEK